tara:strand:+ start:638 stop:1654 length:1017 start_codon:yes stop_codon:yes gene_type:complete
MKAGRILAPKKFELSDIKTPTISTNEESLVKLHSWSICGSDIRDAYGPLFSEENYPMRWGAHCHEAVGTITKSGSKEFPEGQRVIVLPSPAIDGLEEEPGRGGGLLAEYVIGNHNRMIKIPEYGEPNEWVMCQPSGTVLYACQLLGNILGKTVVVLGQGAIGLSFTAILSRAGARNVVAVDSLDYRLDKSKDVGATHVINYKNENLENAIKEINNGEFSDVIIEAAGDAEAFNTSLKMVKPLGQILIFGKLLKDEKGTLATIETEHLLHHGATIINSSGVNSGDPTSHIERMVELKKRGWWDPSTMITHNMEFGDVQKAYDMYENRDDNVIKVVLNQE